ncbi:MAG: methyltransferase [Propionibacterium sp.]|nr:MAG: methyltransferase [Propionibacterium sp.]
MRPNLLPAAILWDFDGTLADTETAWQAAEARLMHRLGIEWSQEDALQLVGKPIDEYGEVLARAAASTGYQPEWFIDHMLSEMVELLETGQISMRPGALELLNQVRSARIPCALVSASWQVLLDAAMGLFPRGSFDAVIAGDKVEQGKPHPESYLLAAERLGVDIADCLVIEDSVTGVAAGLASGARVLGIPDLEELEPAPRLTISHSLTNWRVRDLRRIMNAPPEPNGAPMSGIYIGPLRAGERISLTDPKGRMHTISLQAGAAFHTAKGGIAHDDLVGQPEGTVVTSAGGMSFLALRPHLNEYVVKMPRKAAIVYPKDAGQILVWSDIFPGARVLEAGVGSGALTLFLLRAIGPSGRLISYERRTEFAEAATENVTTFLGSRPPNWELITADLAEATVSGPVDRVILDMLAPWDCIDTVADALVPGGVLTCYVATTTQMGRVMDTVRAHGGFTEPTASELISRPWHAEGLAIRPGHSATGHTGFLTFARRLAPGVTTPVRKRRPAPGAYGSDYTGPRPASVPHARQGEPTGRERM